MDRDSFKARIGKKYREHFWGVNAILAGIVLRFALYFRNDSLFRDESRILLNIADRSFLDLARQLDYGQVAPIPYLWLLRLAHIIGGSSELCLRLPSLLLGLAGLVLFYLLSLRVIKNGYGTAVAIWLFAAAYNLILYSALTKTYILDVFVATLLCYLSYPVLTGGALRAKDVLFLGFLSAAMLWVSYPAVFVAGGIGLGLFLNFRKSDFRVAALFAGIVAVSFSALYFSGLLTHPVGGMDAYTAWRHTFAPHSFDLWYAEAFLKPVDAVMGRARCLQYLISGVCLLGFASALRRKNWVVLAFSAFPVILALIASFLNKYPFEGRLLLFASPGLLLLFGYGAESVRGYSGRLSAAVFVALIILPYTFLSVISFSRPCGGVREAMAYAGEHKTPGDTILADVFAAPSVLFYKNKAGGADFKKDPVFFEAFDEGSPYLLLSPKALISILPPAKPVWLIAEASGYARRGKRLSPRRLYRPRDPGRDQRR